MPKERPSNRPRFLNSDRELVIKGWNLGTINRILSTLPKDSNYTVRSQYVHPYTEVEGRPESSLLLYKLLLGIVESPTGETTGKMTLDADQVFELLRRVSELATPSSGKALERLQLAMLSLDELREATIFRTEGGEIGISSARVQVGDVITAFSDCLLPSILRRERDSQSYRILGFTHCPGLRDDISHLKESDERFGEFVLI